MRPISIDPLQFLFYILPLKRIWNPANDIKSTWVFLQKLKLLYVSGPSEAPVLTVVKTLNSTSIEVEWEPVHPQNRLGHITKYVILYTDEKETGEMNVTASTLKAIINGLRQSTTYTIQVLAATVKGNGPLSDPKTATTEGEEKIKSYVTFL